MSRTADPRRREDILAAARQTFQRDGFAKAHMTAIARRAGIAVGTLYLYFESKDAIARALAAETFAKAAAAIMPILSRRLTRRSITTLVHRTFDTVHENLAASRDIPVADVFPTLAPEAYAGVVAQIATALEWQMEQGIVRRYHPATLADFFVILLRRAVLVSAMAGSGREPYASTLIDLLAAALLDDGRRQS